MTERRKMFLLWLSVAVVAYLALRYIDLIFMWLYELSGVLGKLIWGASE